MKQGKIIVPPIKCQGIKTKLIPFIRATVQWNGKGRWIEPFLGSGVVAFNMAPERALLTDKNEYIIRLYQGIQQGRITAETVRAFLEMHGKKLAEQGNDPAVHRAQHHVCGGMAGGGSWAPCQGCP